MAKKKSPKDESRSEQHETAVLTDPDKRYSHCPSCGGTLVYDIALQKLRCEHCGSTFTPEEVGTLRGAEEHIEDNAGFGMRNAESKADPDSGSRIPNSESITVFTCPNCGAEVQGEETSAAEYCQYCGSFVTLNSRIERLRRPDLIAPFAVTREQCEELYKERMDHTLYVPKELRAGDIKAAFRPMYIPFWSMEAEHPDEVSIKTKESWREGDYSCSREYEISFKSEGRFTNCLFDASKAFDDNISDCIGDYDPEKLAAYDASYMHGSFADMADVVAERYEEEAKDRCRAAMADELRKAIKSTGQGGIFHDADTVDLSLPEDTKANVSWRLAMFPVWFMTYRSRGRVAYSVVNGQTSSMFAEAPVALTKFLLCSLIYALPIFLLLELFLTLRPTEMLGYVSAVTAIVLAMYASNAGEEWMRDRGLRPSDVKRLAADVKKRSIFVRILSMITGAILKICLVFAVITLVFGILEIIAEDDTPILIMDLRLSSLLFAIWSIGRKVRHFDIAAKFNVLLETICGIGAIVIALVFNYYDPVHDEAFYFAAVAAIVGMIISMVFALRRYNRRVTHPIPHFFHGKDGSIA